MNGAAAKKHGSPNMFNRKKLGRSAERPARNNHQRKMVVRPNSRGGVIVAVR